jgi:hypothetical protein
VVFSPGTVTTVEQSGTEVFLSNGTKIILTEKSVVHFKTLKQMEGQELKPDAAGSPTKELGPSITEIEVESGKVVGDVKKLAHESVFTLKTPVGTVRIKGTVFSVEYVVNDKGIASFNVGCARGLVAVEVGGRAMNIKPGQQLSMSAPAPKPTVQGNQPEQKSEDKKGEQPAPAEQAPPPPPEMKIEPLKATTFANIPNFTPPPAPANAPPPPAGPPPAAKADALDKIIQQVEENIDKKQVNPTPVGG